MNWKDEYSARITSAEEAVKHIQSGNRVVIAHACGESPTLSRALVSQGSRLQNVEIIHMVAMGEAEYCSEHMSGHFIHNSLFAGGTTREAINSGRADYIPCFFSEIPRLFREGHLLVDVVLAQVSPPDKHGFCSFGISVDYTMVAANYAKMVIAAVNPKMPRTLGNSFIHVSKIDHIVETDDNIIELPRPKISEVEKEIGRNVASLIGDGFTLQLGIGAIPDAVLLFLKEKTNLGIHTEMFSDGVVELYEAGVITNRVKTLHPNKMICTFLMGGRKLYDFVDNNPIVEMHTVDYTNDSFVISRNDKMVSINSALQVDIMGQVNAETIGYKQYSGVGGQVDFIRGASRSRGGKAIIAMPATASSGSVSRIVSKLDEGACVTTSRNDVHYVVTEYGVANLHGKTLRERAHALITIAHPDFRAELTREVLRSKI